MNAALLSVVLIVVQPTHPSSARASTPFPNYDIATSCAEAPNRAACIQLERAAQARLRAAWRGLSAADQAQCAARGTAAGGSYVAADSCAAQ